MKLAHIALALGLILLLGPWILLDNPNRYWIVVSALGGTLTSIAGYNSQAKMMGRGTPGEDLLQLCWHWLVKKMRKKGR